MEKKARDQRANSMIETLELLTTLRTSKRDGKMAPHKAVLLLAVLELLEEGILRDSCFELTSELEERFTDIWNRFIPSDSVFKPTIATPFYHLRSERFWNVIDNNGDSLHMQTTPTYSFLKKNHVRAQLDTEIFKELKDSSKRDDVKKALTATYLSVFSSGMDEDIAALNQIIMVQQKQLSKLYENNAGLSKGLKEQEAILVNAIEDFKSEIANRDDEIATLTAQVERLNAIITSFQTKVDDDQDDVKESSSPTLDEQYIFLRHVSEEELPNFPSDYKSIRYVYCKQEDCHYEIMYSDLHQDEGSLSTLRIRLYERYQSSPEDPLLVCSCCGRPIFLSGNSGIKGEIVGFRHHGEGNVRSGEHVGEYYNIPKQEERAELEQLKESFMSFVPHLDNCTSTESFVNLPGSDRKNVVGDVMFTYGEKNIAVIFASAGHPLDFIIRRVKGAYEKGYLPIWIMSPSFMYSSAMSNRDIATFSKGYICTVDDDAISVSKHSGEPCLLARNYYENDYAFVKLSTFISDAEESLAEVMKLPEWNSEPKAKRPRIRKTTEKTPAKSVKQKREVTKKRIEIPPMPKPKKSVSIVDFWQGRRFHLKDDLYVEKLDSGYGIINMKTLRYPVLPIYSDIRISEDNKEVTLYLNGKEDHTVVI